MSVNVERLNVRLSGRQILKDLSFSASDSGITAILGPNGSGKTTLLRTINKMIEPEAGSVNVLGEDIMGLSHKEMAKKVSYVPQRARACYISVFDSVLLGRVPHIRFRASQEDVDLTMEIIEKLGLTDQLLQPLYELSGGELQKVAVARALVQKTPIMILDEPTAALDVKNQMEILAMLSQVTKEQGIKVIMTIHDLNTAFRFADEFIFMKDGEVLSKADRSSVDPQIIEEVYDIPVDIIWKHDIPTIIPMHKELRL